MKLVLDVRPETMRILERLAALGIKPSSQTPEIVAAVLIETGLRAVAEDLREKDDPESTKVKLALAGLE